MFVPALGMDAATSPRHMNETLSIGVDMVDVGDVEAAMARFGEKYLARVFTPSEISYALGATDPLTVAQRLAARFAAKEAAPPDSHRDRRR